MTLAVDLGGRLLRADNSDAYVAAIVSALKSAFVFEGADESSVQATISINLVALSCQTFSLVHLLIDHAFGVVIRIVYGDHDGGNYSALSCRMVLLLLLSNGIRSRVSGSFRVTMFIM